MPNYLSFFASSLLLLVIPGPAVLFVVARSMELGARSGVISVVGVILGGLVHVLFAAVGLSAVLATSALAFSAVKYVGAVYLLYLGVTKLLEKSGDTFVPTETAAVASDPLTLLRQGFVVQVLNPKIALFFLAFLPQFVNPSRGDQAVQLVGLGLAFVAMAFVTDSVYAISAGIIGARMVTLRRSPGIAKWTSGLTYLSLGLVTAVSGPSKGGK